MISIRSVYGRSSTLVIAVAFVPASLAAQRRVGLSPELALGAAFERPDVIRPSWTSGRHALLTLDASVPNVPVRLRAEAMAVSLPQSHGPVSVGVSALLPLGRGRLRPYVLGGAALYGIGGVGHPLGWSAGAGAEFRRRTATLFVEARRHSQTPSAASVGVRF